MSLPSPGPVDALMTWAQFKDLFERGVIQEPVTYSGLTSIGSKFTVRRKIVMQRHGKPFLSNKLSLQSVIITDSLGSIPQLGRGFTLSQGGTVTGTLLRVKNPKGSGKVLFLTRLMLFAGGAYNATMYQVFTPAQADLTSLGNKANFILPKNGVGESVATFSTQVVGAPAADKMTVNPSGNVGTFAIVSIDQILGPDSSVDILNAGAGNVDIILDWFEQ